MMMDCWLISLLFCRQILLRGLMPAELLTVEYPYLYTCTVAAGGARAELATRA